MCTAGTGDRAGKAYRRLIRRAIPPALAPALAPARGLLPLDGPRPSKEAFLHAAVYRARPQDFAVVHTHSTHAAAEFCLADVDPHDVLPPLTAYYVMRVGRLPLLPYHAPGDRSLEQLAGRTARTSHALPLANYGPVVSAVDLASAADAVEELEEIARIHLLLHGRPTRPLTPEQVTALRPA